MLSEVFQSLDPSFLSWFAGLTEVNERVLISNTIYFLVEECTRMTQDFRQWNNRDALRERFSFLQATKQLQGIYIKDQEKVLVST